jgi:mannose-6-phosphate isomerase class I
MSIRKTSQAVLPVHKPAVPQNQYDIYPTHDLGSGLISDDFRALARRLAGKKQVIVDGYVGVRFDLFVQELNRALCDEGVRPLWWSVDATLLPAEEIDRKIAPFLGGDDPIFGFRTSLGLGDFFDEERLCSIKPDPASDMNIIFGSGAALADWEGELIYIDIPKNEIQFRARAGSVTNIGAAKADLSKKMYKRFYFVDWVVLNRHKKALLPKIDIIVDGQREAEITWMEGSDLRKGLDRIAGNGFRVRPWFEPGAWGGQWIREHIESLPHDVPNYAWSFELIVPENGLIFGSDDKMLEVSFDMAMFQAGAQVVGEECYKEYGDEFPLRMDYLDNFEGGNLSIQCHPQRDYIRKNFGEVLTQEETYYVLDTTPDAVVYLGMTENANPKEFENALRESAEKGTELDVQRYINAEPSVKHGFYLIPPGTLHSSGVGNLVLEISTTPYIFTFKMYDWLALDLDGRPRPLNIARAMDNLCFDRKGEIVKQELVSHPALLEKGADWELWHLPTHPNHSYDVHRYVVGSSVEVKTEGRCHVLNLVEGESAEIETAGGEQFHLNYAETLVLSAAADSYRILNSSSHPIMLVKAFMKSEDEK